MPLIDFFQEKMREKTFRWLLTILVAFVVYLNAEAGRLLGIKGLPLAFSAVWPASGFSLATLLLFGNRGAPGVFWGNFIYNIIHLYAPDEQLLPPLITSLIVTFGSLAQALLGAHLIRRYSTPGYFNTLKDTFIFLLLGGAFTCMIAPTVGVTTLYFYGALSPDMFFFSWLTFWIGDTLGVYIVTPLIVIWSLKKPTLNSTPKSWEVLLMFLAYGIAGIYTFQGYPIGYLFLPLNIWTIYRFSFHGYTLAMGYVVLSIILPFSYGRGPNIYGYSTEMLLILVSFLETMVAASLVVAACMKERFAALKVLERYNVDLTQAFKVDTFLEK